MSDNSKDTNLTIDDYSTHEYKYTVGATGSTYTIDPTNWAMGSILTTGTNTNWTIGTPGTTWGIGAVGQNTWSNDTSLSVNGEGADIKVNGKSLCKAIEAIEERLAILQPNLEIEKEWEELKQLGDQYRKLEADIKEKMVVWDTLKKTEFDK